MRTQVRKAFTLVEILIVVVILGILAAIVVPQFTNATQDAQAGNIKAQLDTLNNQIELFRARTNAAPAGLVAGGDVTVWDAMIDGGYIKTAPRNPFNGLSDVATASSTTTGWVFVNNTLYATNFNNDPLDTDDTDGDGAFGQITPGSTKLPS
jgi:prepilin-type N-terminal cleavage/methylation domain-containing protein